MEKSSFFNSISGDRVYGANEWAEYFASFIGNGIFPMPSNNLQVVSNTGMIIKARAGKAWINGYFYNNTSDLSITLATADGVLNRIDRIVVRWDLTNRTISTVVKSSSPATNPTAPTLQRDADAYELCLADVLVGAGVTGITQANITDRRYNTSLCGVVVGVVQQIDPSSITAQFDNFFEMYRLLIAQRYGQYNEEITLHQNAAVDDYEAFLAWLEAYKTIAQNDFQEWFDGIKDILGTDVAGQLALEIAALQGRVDVLEEEISNIPKFSVAAWLGNSHLGNAYLSTI